MYINSYVNNFFLDDNVTRGHSTLLINTSAGQLEDCQEILLPTPGAAMVAALEKIRKKGVLY